MRCGSAWRGTLAGLVLAFGGWAGETSGARAASDPAVVNALAEVSLFAGLTADERNTLATVTTRRRGKAGERIIEQGKPIVSMFVILEGQAEVRVSGTHVVDLPRQSLVGEIEFLDGRPASADVVLSGETDLLVLDNALLAALMEKQPRLGYVLMRELARLEAQRLRNTNPK